MSGIRPVLNVHIPDIKMGCPEYGQYSLAICQTSNFDVRNMDRYLVPIPDITVHIPDINVPIPDIIVHIPDITVLIPDINFMKNSMSGIWTVKTGLIPDINF